ncbi:MAG: hypothetical protein NC231_03900 [Bacillus sp. (in: Bacteria)]|nr:hypothetical protein [Bacillus sp. (in: firmicutes)]MCM1424984.1 hypothetical protein [Eubacterium sp.]
MTKDKQTYLEQIEKYYKHNLSRFDLIHIGMTPDIMIAYGAGKLPLMIQQSTLTKCTRMQTGSRSAHELHRNIIETIPEQIQRPIFLIQDKERNSIVLITDAKDKKNNNILIAIKLNERKNAMLVNEIKSIYGKANLKEYLLKHNRLNQLHVIDNRKAERLSRLVGFQLPQALIASSYNENIPLKSLKVNDKISVHNKLKQYKKEIQVKEAARPQTQREKEQSKER